MLAEQNPVDEYVAILDVIVSRDYLVNISTRCNLTSQDTMAGECSLLMNKIFSDHFNCAVDRNLRTLSELERLVI